MNEFSKKYEFYDEYHEDDEHKKYGGFRKGQNNKNGDQHEISYTDDQYSGGRNGKKGQWHHGIHKDELKGHLKDAGEKKQKEYVLTLSKKDNKSGDRKWELDKSVIR